MKSALVRAYLKHIETSLPRAVRLAPLRSSSSETRERSCSRYVNRTRYGSTAGRTPPGTSSRASKDRGSGQDFSPWYMTIGMIIGSFFAFG
jgi:hypothetical protein